MSKPSIKVVIAIFETYLSIRQSKWNLKELDNGTVELPEPTSWEGKKLEVCKQLLQHIYAIKNMNPNKVDMHKWTDLILELHHHEVEQFKLYNSQTLGWQHVLLDVIRAMRNYIIKCYDRDKKFGDHIAQLKSIQKDHEIDVGRFEKYKDGHSPNDLIQAEIGLKKTNSEIDSLTIKNDWLNDYFVDQIVAHDPLYAKLKEADFEAFKKNAEDGVRTGVLCQKVMDSMKKVMRASNSANSNEPVLADGAAPAPTATIANSNIVDISQSKPGYDLISDMTDSPGSPEDQTPKQAKAKKSGRSALRANSTFSAEPPTTKEQNKQAYNTRSKAAPSHNKN